MFAFTVHVIFTVYVVFGFADNLFLGRHAGYLWGIPQHREVWKQLAAEKGGRGLYLSFCDVMCNDSQYLLDDVIKTLPEVWPPVGQSHCEYGI